jgi:hypothetical protein
MCMTEPTRERRAKSYESEIHGDSCGDGRLAGVLKPSVFLGWDGRPSKRSEVPQETLKHFHYLGKFRPVWL